MKYWVDSLGDPDTPEKAKAEIRGLIRALELAEFRADSLSAYLTELNKEAQVVDAATELAELDFNKYRNIWKQQLDELL